MTVGMFMCMTQNEEMCTVGTSTCLSCEEAPRWMSMIWFSNNTSKSGDEQISMKETCGLCEGKTEQHSLQHCFQLSGWRVTTLLNLRYVLTRDRVNVCSFAFFKLFLVFSVFVLSHTLLGSCALMDIHISKYFGHFAVHISHAVVLTRS